MNYHVHAVEQDLAGKWYARVCITENEAIFLKFQEYPSMEDIQSSASDYVAALEQQEIDNAASQ